MNLIKELAKTTFLYEYVKSKRQRRTLMAWEKNPGPKKGPLPHTLKQYTVKDYAHKYGCPVLVETGTFEGDMVKACLGSFKKIFSIELDEVFYRKAVKKFSSFPHVKIVQGDSGEKLAELLKEIKVPCVFWLDGHYSAGPTAKGSLETPIAMEIEHIFNHDIQDHVILIDDARCFDGTNDYPKLQEFTKELHKRKQGIRVEMYNDIIRITPDKPVLL